MNPRLAASWKLGRLSRASRSTPAIFWAAPLLAREAKSTNPVLQCAWRPNTFPIRRIIRIFQPQRSCPVKNFTPPPSTNFPSSRERMSSRTVSRHPFVSCHAIFLLLIFAGATRAQANDTSQSAKKLTVERIYSEPSLSGHTLRGITWTPDGKQVSFLEAKRAEDDAGDGVENEHRGKHKKERNTDLWIVDAT